MKNNTVSKLSPVLFITAILLLTALPATFANTAAIRTERSEQAKYPSPVQEILPLIENGSFLVDLPNAKATELAFNEDVSLRPASTLKVVTALAALEILGPSFTFHTEFYLDGDILYIKGFGDPYLTSERVAQICRRLASILQSRNISSIQELRLDNSSFAVAQSPSSGNSANPYDAPSGALAVNFNSLPLQVDKHRTVHSAEPQTPLLPIFTEIGASLPPGSHRVNLFHYHYSSKENPGLRYVAELFSRMLEDQGIEVHGWREEQVPKNVSILWTSSSEVPLTQLVKLCLEYSNNFMANQFFLTCGAARYGYPADWQKARKALASFISERLPQFMDSFSVVDGSGLSVNNRLSATGLVSVLNLFTPYAGLLPEKNGILVKSGTLTGTYSYCGYFRFGEDLIPFTLLLNQSANERDAVLKALFQATKVLYPLSPEPIQPYRK